MSKATGTIVGRLARDPESRTTGSGTQLVTCTIPTESGWGNGKATTWWRITLFGKKADIVAKHMSKGKWAMFTGEFSVREYTKKDGTKGVSAEMTASDFAFVGNKSDNESGGQSNGYSKPAPSSTPSQQNSGGAPFADDDIPFAWILVPLLPSLMVLGDVAGMVA
jgi:single-strand DNA-binding protein